MGAGRNTGFRSLNYSVGALAILVISVGVAAIVYSTNAITFDLFNVPAWIFGPAGVYTLAYSFVGGKDSTYYLVWGAVMFAVAVVSAFYAVVNPFIVLGVLIIVIAVIGLFTYWRSKK